jgi:hypothetical protein
MSADFNPTYYEKEKQEKQEMIKEKQEMIIEKREIDNNRYLEKTSQNTDILIKSNDELIKNTHLIACILTDTLDETKNNNELHNTDNYDGSKNYLREINKNVIKQTTDINRTIVASFIVSTSVIVGVIYYFLKK